MAYVADFTEEELQRALDAQGGAPAVSGAPAAAPSGGASPAGPAIPSGAAPAGGAETGTGFVNLSRYFDANQDTAGKMAAGVIDPLKIDLAPIGQAAASAAVPDIGPAPEPLTYPNTALGQQQAVADATAQRYGAPNQLDQQNQANASAYEAALAQATKAAQDAARDKAISDARTAQINKGQDIIGNADARNAALTKDGREPSAFDSYLTGASLTSQGATPGGPFAGLLDYYGIGARGPNSGRTVLAPGAPGAPTSTTVPPPAPPMAAERPAGSALPPPPGTPRPPPPPRPPPTAADALLTAQKRKPGRGYLEP